MPIGRVHSPSSLRLGSWGPVNSIFELSNLFGSGRAVCLVRQQLRLGFQVYTRHRMSVPVQRPADDVAYQRGGF